MKWAVNNISGNLLMLKVKTKKKKNTKYMEHGMDQSMSREV
jgi:hypothetical protein